MCPIPQIKLWIDPWSVFDCSIIVFSNNNEEMFKKIHQRLDYLNEILDEKQKDR